MQPGKFITLEGIEGVGKTTNLSFVAEYLKSAGIKVVQSREPGGTRIAEKIRALLLDKDDEALCDESELLLVFAARAQHIQQVIRPALEAGNWVLCDRFTDATFAYQGGGRNFPAARIEWLEAWIQQGLHPDLTLLLDVPVELGLSRARNRAELDRFESEHVDFFRRVQLAYYQRAEQSPQRFYTVDTSHPIEVVQSLLAKRLDQMLADDKP